MFRNLLKMTIDRFPHLILNPLLQLRFIRRNVLDAIQSLLDGLLNHIDGNIDTRLPHIRDVGQKRRLGILQRGG